MEGNYTLVRLVWLLCICIVLFVGGYFVYQLMDAPDAENVSIPKPLSDAEKLDTLRSLRSDSPSDAVSLEAQLQVLKGLNAESEETASPQSAGNAELPAASAEAENADKLKILQSL